VDHAQGETCQPAGLSALAAILLALFAARGRRGELGTLFHTPQERERLDRLRRGEPEPAPAQPPRPVPPASRW
jgi:hypothetical protein